MGLFADGASWHIQTQAGLHSWDWHGPVQPDTGKEPKSSGGLSWSAALDRLCQPHGKGQGLPAAPQAPA